MYEMIPYTICYHRRKPSKTDSVQEILVENICDLRHANLKYACMGMWCRCVFPIIDPCSTNSLCVAHVLSGHEVISS